MCTEHTHTHTHTYALWKHFFNQEITESLSTETNLSWEALATQLPEHIKTELTTMTLYLSQQAGLK